MADDRARGGVILLTEVIEEGLPPESLGDDKIAANIDRIFDQRPGDMKSDLLDDSSPKAAVSPQEEEELAALLKEVGGAESKPAQPKPAQPKVSPAKPGAKPVLDDLEALLAEVGGTPSAASAEPVPESRLPQPDNDLTADLETLISGSSGEAKAAQKNKKAEPEGKGAMDQTDLDALLGEAAAAPRSEAKPKPMAKPPAEPAEAMDQSDLDALLAEVGGAPPPKERPKPSAKPPAEPVEAMGQSDLDALLAEAAAAPRSEAKPKPTAKPSAEPAGGAMDQSELDALLAKLDSGQIPPAKAAKPTPPARSAAPDDDLDDLLSEAAVGFTSHNLVPTAPVPPRPRAKPSFVPPSALAQLDSAEAGLPAEAVERILRQVAAQVFEKVAREVIPQVTEAVLTREITALRRELEKNVD